VDCFASTIKIFKEHQVLDFGSKIVKRIEKRWKEWEHPLLILSIILHPDYKLKKFQSTNNNLTWIYIAEIILYKQSKDPYDYETFLQFNVHLINYWNSTASIGSELANDIFYYWKKKMAKELDTKIQYLHMPIFEEDLNSFLQVNIIKTNENIDNEDNLSLSELDESYSEEQIQEWNIFIEE
ncbi:6424_t:CDS:2, partial [Dentiscutata erythropus]